VATAWTLAVYGLGLPAFVLHKVLQPLFYAREDTARPFNYAVWSMVVNAAVAVGLALALERVAPGWGFLGAALGTTVAGWTMVWQLWRGSRGMDGAGAVDARLRARLPRIGLAAAVMGVVLAGAAWALDGPLHAPGWRYLALAGLCCSGLVAYFGTGVALRAFRPSDLRGALRR
jgi:putative peptidoglycan lipid II flippase